ncbi:DHH family phosphoesterase [Paraclostridium sordellii]|uniref:DHH family phosphoesterase n=1 Tax=Paraclostridium sordellii TaxID=1505 RepID=UPI0005DAF42E|nr:bifunctional oligoribonuclease/PAP phosphatase NrnA [Paeniclostridium sordellii]MCQ4695901.1 bifunctional oligoribonuclease/PAP phosphatase NrnA [Paeniclostridium sordellii]MDU6480943.1 bifunctional oligoribonuclease/PAP phosphatase NrnA [Paeniclostridium sordellii]MVO73911.1 bifunctional oligoribonuclease/PAP phosphatase NrnA [Paeniclostridium sordellii]CEN76065.1 RNA-binding protein [[Clostridium] sordellii] [Paeniclostridium sordellii]CEN82493.1 RNA-binding protein [[Clostridium] sordell
MLNNIKNIIKAIREGNNFIVTSHYSPDGDNIGSTLSMYYTLKKLGKKVYYVLDDSIPLNLTFLVKDVKILKSEEMNENLNDYTLISLDCGDFNRICVSESIKKSVKQLICIDHHASNNNYGDLNYINPNESSTCELVYNLLKEFSKEIGEQILDEDISTYLYTGLLTDTGNFSYSNTNPSSYLMAYDLVNLGAKKDLIIQKIFQSNTYNYYKLLGEALDTLEIVDKKIASMMLTIDMLERNEISFNDADGVTSYTRDIDGVEVGLLFKEKAPGEVKVSFRSKNYVDVSAVAQVFGGGGHVRASGCTIKDSIENVKKIVINEVLKHI